MELHVEHTPPFRVPAGKAGQTLLFPAGHVRSTYLSHRVGPLLHAAQRGGARDAGMGMLYPIVCLVHPFCLAPEPARALWTLTASPKDR